jgi:hypothetical protein
MYYLHEFRNKKTMILEPGEGFDEIKFGMTEEEVIALLGEPNVRRIKDEEDEDRDIVYQYNELKVKLEFDAEDELLFHVRTTNPKAKLDGITIIDQPLDTFFADLKTKRTDWEEEKFSSFNSYFYDEKCLSIAEEFGRIIDVHLYWCD